MPRGRHVAIVGDAELDEGNIYEALLEGWKHDIRNVWWVIDYNRQSLDAIVSDRLVQRIDAVFNLQPPIDDWLQEEAVDPEMIRLVRSFSTSRRLASISD